MASLSRGLFLPGLRPAFAPRAILPELPVFRSRFFTTSLRFCAAAKNVAKAPKPKKPIPATTGLPPSRYAFIKNLASKPTPTILYEGPSHFWFYFGCWSSGLFILCWTGATFQMMTHQPEGTPQWVNFVYTATYALLVAMAFYLISKTPNIVHTIRLLPRQAATPAATPAARAGPAAFQQPQMELVVKPMLPFLRRKVVTADLDKVTLESRFSLPDEFVPELRRLERKREEEERKAALQKYDMEHIMTMPFRRLARAFRRMFNGIRSAWTDSGFGTMKVDGKSYKVDITGGFAHDGFRTLEKLLH